MRSIALLPLALCCVLLPAITLAQDAGSDDPRPTITFFNLSFKLKPQTDYNIERIALGLSIFFIVKMIIGRKTNKNLAILYVAEMDRDDGILKKQFAEAEPTVIIDGPETFKFHATGRRYCQGALFTFRMASRQDLLSTFTKFSGGSQRDILEIEVNMNENAMPSTVLFVGTHSAAKAVTKENRDIVELTKRLEPTRDRLATWPGVSGNEDGSGDQPSPLVVHAEHPSVFYEIMSPPIMDVLFGPNAFYNEDMSRYFRYLHASSDFRSPAFSENSVGATGKRPVVRVSFNLPPSGNYEVLDKFVTFVCLIIDGLGSCKLTPEQIKKSADLRRTVEAKRESTIVEKEKKLEERRAAKEAEERARLAKLPPEQREKERAKRDKILRKRSMKSAVKRM
jgi:Protein of unknown function (DUF1682)